MKPDFKWSNSFTLSRVDKATTETSSFVSVIANVPAPIESVVTQVDDHVRRRLISHLINVISRVLQNLFKYFNGTTILTSFVSPAAVLFVIFTLDSNDVLVPEKLTMLSLSSKAG